MQASELATAQLHELRGKLVAGLAFALAGLAVGAMLLVVDAFSISSSPLLAPVSTAEATYVYVSGFVGLLLVVRCLFRTLGLAARIAVIRRELAARLPPVARVARG